MLVLQTTDIVPCTIGKLTVWVSPLSWNIKTRLLKHTVKDAGADSIDETQLLFETLKYSVKQIDGLNAYTLIDGSHPKLEFVDGALDESATEMLIRMIGMSPASQLSSMILAENWSQDMSDVLVDFENAKKKN